MLKIKNNDILVKPTQNGNISVWAIDTFNTTYFVVYGTYPNYKYVETELTTVTKIKTAYNKRIDAGYTRLSDITTNFTIDDEEVEVVIKEYFKKNNILVNSDGIYIPMKANKLLPTTKSTVYPYIGQRKYNGIRAMISYKEKPTNDMFAQEWQNVIITSNGGKEYYMPHISRVFYDAIYSYPANRDSIYDGEFYIHGKDLNYIKSCVPLIVNGKPSIPSGNPLETKFVMFDMINHVDDIQKVRIDNLDKMSKLNILGSYVEYAQSVKIRNFNEAVYYRDKFINEKYEGLIMRHPNWVYQFGKRNAAMWKFKLAKTNEFKIVDVINKGFKSGRVNVTVLLKNNLDNNTFEATPGDINNSWDNESKQELYDNREKYIGKLGTVSYYERSGVKGVPYHANFVTVRDYE